MIRIARFFWACDESHSTTTPDAAEIRNGYDAAGRLASVTDPRGSPAGTRASPPRLMTPPAMR
ncbi:RHS repeat domain-containing protein [Methylosinus sp. Sm6]|uniref:RHS repeat domain-containing protein n=1 Tax=Methylosinus sp. Sm6 TaxID=2866948 RepID=UPI002102CB35|nr:RHS repeat domain-containing protein [Methylosinus sp. Sm6]